MWNEIRFFYFLSLEDFFQNGLCYLTESFLLQEAFDDFDDVDMLYNTLPLDKVESLEDLVTICPPGIVKGVGATAAVSSIKSTLSTSAQSSVCSKKLVCQQYDTCQLLISCH